MANPYLDQLVKELEDKKEELEWKITEAQEYKQQVMSTIDAQASVAQDQLTAITEAIVKIEEIRAELGKV